MIHIQSKLLEKKLGPLVLKYRVVEYFWLLNNVSRTLYLLGHTLLTFSQSALRYYGCDRLSESGCQKIFIGSLIRWF